MVDTTQKRISVLVEFLEKGNLNKSSKQLSDVSKVLSEVSKKIQASSLRDLGASKATLNKFAKMRTNLAVRGHKADLEHTKQVLKENTDSHKQALKEDIERTKQALKEKLTVEKKKASEYNTAHSAAIKDDTKYEKARAKTVQMAANRVKFLAQQFQKVKVASEKAKVVANRFKMEYLGLMFAGMALQRQMQGAINSSRVYTRATERMNRTMGKAVDKSGVMNTYLKVMGDITKGVGGDVIATTWLLGGFLAQVGQVMLALGSFKIVFGNLGGSVGSFGGTISKLTALFGGLLGKMRLGTKGGIMFGSMFDRIAQVAGSASSKFKIFLDWLGVKLANSVSGAVELFRWLARGISSSLSAIGQLMFGVWDFLVVGGASAIKGVLAGFSGLKDKLSELLTPVINTVKSSVDEIVGFFTGLGSRISPAIDTVGKLLSGLLSSVYNTTKSGLDEIGRFIGAAGKLLGGLGGRTWELILAFAMRGWQLVQTALLWLDSKGFFTYTDKLWSLLVNFTAKIGGTFAKFFSTAGGWLMSAVSTVVNFSHTLTGALSNFFSMLGLGGGGFIGKAIGKITTTISMAAGTMGSSLSSFFGKLGLSGWGLAGTAILTVAIMPILKEAFDFGKKIGEDIGFAIGPAVALSLGGTEAYQKALEYQKQKQREDLMTGLGLHKGTEFGSRAKGGTAGLIGSDFFKGTGTMLEELTKDLGPVYLNGVNTLTNTVRLEFEKDGRILTVSLDAFQEAVSRANARIETINSYKLSSANGEVYNLEEIQRLIEQGHGNFLSGLSQARMEEEGMVIVVEESGKRILKSAEDAKKNAEAAGERVKDVGKAIEDSVKSMAKTASKLMDNVIPNAARDVLKSIPIVGTYLKMIPGFAKGGLVPEDTMAMVHRGEMILPTNLSSGLQNLISIIGAGYTNPLGGGKTLIPAGFGASGGTQDFIFNVNNPTIRSNEDYDRLLDEMERRWENRIRSTRGGY